MTRRYWDACTFLGWLKGEDDKVAECRSVIEEAVSGKLQIVTSALTLAEVLWLTQGKRIPRDDRNKVRECFAHSWIVLWELDRQIAERAQEVVWEHNVEPKDSVHVATALAAGAQQLDTFDVPLIQRDGKIDNLRIGRPEIEGKLPLT